MYKPMVDKVGLFAYMLLASSKNFCTMFVFTTLVMVWSLELYKGPRNFGDPLNTSTKITYL